jgi:hypothetical protein
MGMMFTAVPTSLSDTGNYQTRFKRSECAATVQQRVSNRGAAQCGRRAEWPSGSA